MIDISKLKIGDKVHYVRDNDTDHYENGMVKALTHLSNLRLGWKH